MSDASRQFAALPESIPFAVLRAYLAAMPSATATNMLNNPSAPRNKVKTIATLGMLSVLLAVGCGRKGTPPRPHAAKPAAVNMVQPSDEYNAYLADWFRNHGEKSVVSTPEGVCGRENTPRFWGRTYNVADKGNQGFLVETEFGVSLPDGRVVQECVVGLGPTAEQAKAEAVANFTLSEIHVLYSALVNAEDPHLRPILMPVAGNMRNVYTGDWGIRVLKNGAPPPTGAQLEGLQKQFLGDVGRRVSGNELHWIKLVYGQNKGQDLTCEVTMDNIKDEELTAAMKRMPWPKSDGFYMLKLFVLVK